MVVKNSDGFPSYLLQRSNAERYQYFADYTCAHTVIKNGFESLLYTIQFPAGKQLIVIIGPPRVGKSFLFGWIKDELQSLWVKQEHQDPGRIPVIGLEVPSKDNSRRIVNDVYIRILQKLEEPLIDKKVVYGDVAVYRNKGNEIVVEAASGARYRRAVESALQQRQPTMLFDEAQHFLDIAGLSIEEVMDWIKSLANMTKVIICLFGTYELLQFLDLSDQLMFRSKIIHLYRYGSSEEHVCLFNSTVDAFQRHMPLMKEPNLLRYSEFLHERTVGCVGNLYHWLLAAYDLAVKDGGKTLTLKHLQATVPLTAIRAKKANNNISKDEATFAAEIGENDEGVISSMHNEDSSLESSQSEKQERRATGKRRNRVGERNPERDKTGERRKVA